MGPIGTSSQRQALTGLNIALVPLCILYPPPPRSLVMRKAALLCTSTMMAASPWAQSHRVNSVMNGDIWNGTNVSPFFLSFYFLHVYVVCVLVHMFTCVWYIHVCSAHTHCAYGASKVDSRALLNHSALFIELGLSIEPRVHQSARPAS